jgi:hypothetical protein
VMTVFFWGGLDSVNKAHDSDVPFYITRIRCVEGINTAQEQNS